MHDLPRKLSVAQHLAAAMSIDRRVACVDRISVSRDEQNDRADEQALRRTTPDNSSANAFAKSGTISAKSRSSAGTVNFRPECCRMAAQPKFLRGDN
jgi:hypothetical protein